VLPAAGLAQAGDVCAVAHPAEAASAAPIAKHFTILDNQAPGDSKASLFDIFGILDS
jgi:hypothetical protein